MYPCAFRIATLDQGTLHLETERVTEINADTGGVPFQDYAKESLRAGLPALVMEQLMSDFGLQPAQAAAIAPLVVDALMANYAGDEVMTAQAKATIEYLRGPEQPPLMQMLGTMLHAPGYLGRLAAAGFRACGASVESQGVRPDVGAHADPGTARRQQTASRG